MKKSALDFMENRRIKRVLSVLLFSICIAYVIVSSISIYDWYYTHRDMPSDLFMYYIKNDGVTIFSPQPPITFKEGLELIFRIWLKVAGAIMYGNALYLWAWNDFLNREQKFEIAGSVFLGTFAFYVSGVWIWAYSMTVFCPCLLIFIYSAYRLFLAFKSDDYMPKTKPILGMLISACIWIMLKMIL